MALNDLDALNLGSDLFQYTNKIRFLSRISLDINQDLGGRKIFHGAGNDGLAI